MMDRDDLDGLAAEYVLGTLDRDERAAVTLARAHNTILSAAITAWERRLAPLNDDTPEEMPAPGLFAKIERRIDALRITSESVHLARRMRLWRGLAVAASLALVVTLGFAVSSPPAGQNAPMAFLQKDAASPAFMVSLNEKDKSLTVQPVAAAALDGKSYELWLLTENAPAPQSLGVLPPHEIKKISLNSYTPAMLNKMVLAVSIEPPGGSPTGSPTGPVVFTGKFVDAKL